MEYDEMPVYAREGLLFDRAMSLFGPRDGTRMLVRIGGRSADHTYWETPPPKNPKHLIEIGQNWMDELNVLVRRDRLRVILDLNLAVDSPTLETNFARAALAVLPRFSLAGLEIGNEPDLYWRVPPLWEARVPSTLPGTPSRWAVNYSPPDYRRDYIAYARRLTAKLPGIPLGGPAIAYNTRAWLLAVDHLGSLGPRFITIHRYPGSNCLPSNSPSYPTIPLILNESSSAGLAGSIRDAATFAHTRREALRLTEVGSIACGGIRGVANSFATALWAPDMLFEMIRAGVDSVSWHIRPRRLNAPWEPTKNGIQPMPELYGLAAFAQMIRPGAELLNSTVSSALHVKGWAVRTPHGMSVLMINKGARPAYVTLRLGTGNRRAVMRRLRAPRLGTEHGVTFGGQFIGSDALWHGQPVATMIQGRSGKYGLALPGYSAALVRVTR
jgi:hypothetical protein